MDPRGKATYDDVLALPEHVTGELIDGELYTQARPRGPHARAASGLGVDLGGPFDRGRDVDRLRKLPVYAREGVRHVWLVDPDARTVEALALVDRRFLLLGYFGETKEARIAPFDAVPLDLDALFER